MTGICTCWIFVFGFFQQDLLENGSNLRNQLFHVLILISIFGCNDYQPFIMM